MANGGRQMTAILMVLLWVLAGTGEFSSCNGAEIAFVLMHDMPAVSKYPNRLHQLLRLQKYASKLTTKHDSFLASQFPRGGYQKLYSYTHVVNGFAAVLESEQVNLLQAHPAVRHVRTTRKAQLLTTHSPTFLGLPTGVWPKFGGAENAGEGVVIGVIDTGIDPTHPSFRNDPKKPYKMFLPHFDGQCDIGSRFPNGSCNGKIVAGRYFNKAIKASGDFNLTMDLESPFDTNGHGSHAASIAAGNEGVKVTFNGVNMGTASGMAPRARIAAYRCLYSNPSSGDEADVVAAIDQAVRDGVDIISISLNFDPEDNVTTFLTVVDVAMLFATKAGVFIAQSAGNNGPRPHSMRSNSPWVSTVAASTTDRKYVQTLVLGKKVTISSLHTISPGTAQGKMYRIVAAASARRNESSSAEAFACQSPGNYDQTVVQNKILLCIFSEGVAVTRQALEAVERTVKILRGVGLVLDVNNANQEGRTLYVFGVPALVINDSDDVKAFYKYFKSTQKPIGKILGGLQGDTSHEAPLVATFSARGPSFAKLQTQNPIDLLKPNILAPGSSIWGAYSATNTILSDFQGERFALLSGTSMAAPHVAGVAALIKQMHPSWGPATIASALSTSANVQDNEYNMIFNDQFKDATSYDFGSGLINAKRALDPGLIFDTGFEDYINFVCSVEEVSKKEVQKAIGLDCNRRDYTSTLELNTPSLVVTNSSNTGSTLIRRVTNVASCTETYNFEVIHDTKNILLGIDIEPTSFTIKPNESIDIIFRIISYKPSNSSKKASNIYFGNIRFLGDQGHYPRIPLIVFPPLLYAK